MRELSLNVMDVVQNSITAKAARIEIVVAENSSGDELVIEIRDDGCGMEAEQLERVQSPFYSTRTTRKIGMGVPLFKMAAEMTGGSFSIDSTPGKGTHVRATFNAAHIDMTPVGDMNETILLLVSCNPTLDFVYTRSRGDRSFVLDTVELREVLGDVPLNAPDVVTWIREFLTENQSTIDE